MIRTFFVSLLIGSISLAQEPKAKPAPTKLAPEVTAALEAHPGLVYASYGQREMQLDLWKPKNAEQPLPAIICIHGGGWFKGERSSMANLAQALAAKGFVTATISYRLSGEAKFQPPFRTAKLLCASCAPTRLSLASMPRPSVSLAFPQAVISQRCSPPVVE